MPAHHVPLWMTALLLVFVGVVVIGVMKTKETTQVDPSFSDTVSTTNVTFASTTALDEWVFAERAQNDVQTLGEGQYIQFGVVQDPVRDEIMYFATAAYDADAEKNHLSIYRYNERTYEFERLARGTFGRGASSYLSKQAWPVWYVIGYDNNGLIILLRDGDDVLIGCDEPLLVGIGNDAALLRLDLADPSTGLVAWEPPTDLIAVAQQRQETCEDRQ